MKLNIDLNRIGSNLRQAAAIVGVIISTTNLDHLPANIRSLMLVVAGAILTAEHIIAGLQGLIPGNSQTITDQLQSLTAAVVASSSQGSAATTAGSGLVTSAGSPQAEIYPTA